MFCYKISISIVFKCTTFNVVRYFNNKKLIIFKLPSSSISLGSGLAGFVSGLGSISPGLSLRGSSTASSPSSFFCA